MMGYSYLLNNGEIITTYDHPASEITEQLVRIAEAEGLPLTEEVIANYEEAPHFGSIQKYVGSIVAVNTAVERALKKKQRTP